MTQKSHRGRVEGEGDIPLGSLESPYRTGHNAHVIKIPSQDNYFTSIVRRWFSCCACLLFLPVSILGRVFEFFLTVRETVTHGKPSNLEGKVVLITGASSGLGECLARCLYKEGCKLIVAARRYNELERVRDQLVGSALRKGNVYPPVIIQLDLQDLTNLPDKIKTVLGVYGHIDILINNAGISYRGEVINTSLDVDMMVMNVNYFGTVALTKAVLPSMISRREGHIVMIGSVQAKLAVPFRSAYASSKHALQAFSDCLRAEVSHNNINVTVVNPGYIRTNLSLNAVTSAGERYGQMDDTTASGVDPLVAAADIVKAIKEKKDELMLCSIFYRLVLYFRVAFPKAYFIFMERRARRAIKSR